MAPIDSSYESGKFMIVSAVLFTIFLFLIISVSVVWICACCQDESAEDGNEQKSQPAPDWHVEDGEEKKSNQARSDQSKPTERRKVAKDRPRVKILRSEHLKMEVTDSSYFDKPHGQEDGELTLAVPPQEERKKWIKPKLNVGSKNPTIFRTAAGHSPPRTIQLPEKASAMPDLAKTLETDAKQSDHVKMSGVAAKTVQAKTAHAPAKTIQSKRKSIPKPAPKLKSIQPPVSSAITAKTAMLATMKQQSESKGVAKSKLFIDWKKSGTKTVSKLVDIPEKKAAGIQQHQQPQLNFNVVARTVLTPQRQSASESGTDEPDLMSKEVNRSAAGEPRSYEIRPKKKS